MIQEHKVNFILVDNWTGLKDPLTSTKFLASADNQNGKLLIYDRVHFFLFQDRFYMWSLVYLIAKQNLLSVQALK